MFSLLINQQQKLNKQRQFYIYFNKKLKKMNFFICKCDKNDFEDKTAENLLYIKNLEQSLKRGTLKYNDNKSLNSLNVMKSIPIPEKLEIIEYPYTKQKNINFHCRQNKHFKSKHPSSSKINKSKINYNFPNNKKKITKQKSSSKNESIIIDDIDYLDDEDNDFPDNKYEGNTNYTNNNFNLLTPKNISNYRSITIRNNSIKGYYTKNCLNKNNGSKKISRIIPIHKYKTLNVKTKERIFNHSHTKNKMNQLNKKSNKHKFKSFKIIKNFELTKTKSNGTKVMDHTKNKQLIKNNKNLLKSKEKDNNNNKINNTCLFGKNHYENKNTKKELNINKKVNKEKIKINQNGKNQISPSKYSQKSGRVDFLVVEPVNKKTWI